MRQRDYTWCVVLGGDHIYKMDYMKMLQYHIEKKADLSIANIITAKEQATRFGIIEIDDAGNGYGLDLFDDISLFFTFYI